jgi:aminopeptidase N
MLEPGISQQLASDRAPRVRDLRYQLALTIPAARGGRIAGRETITFQLAGAGRPLALDFEPNAAGAVHAVEVNGTPASTALRDGHLPLSDGLREGANRVAIDFDAGDAPLNRNDDYLYTIFVPARAHEAFPCFDQPDLKARWSLTLDVPENWETLANGAEASRSAAAGRTRVAFAETAPISTYLFAFAAGKFSVERAERNGRPFRMLHRETDTAKVARNRDAIFDLHAAALSWLEDYTGIPYPFGKFDFLLVPAFQFGGMEHPGAIFYNASGLMLEPSASENQQLERASTISHETAHMWFGDLVTMRWFADVWMKEVFANFMAAKIVNPSFPHINHELRFLLSYYPAAYDVDRTAGTNAIRQPLENLKDAGTLYGAIIYQKAPIVMRQLETLVGAGAFRDGLRDYLKRFQFANASWPDLIAQLGARTPEDLGAWSRAWVEEAGRPIITTGLEVQQGRIAALTFRQRDPYPARGLTWTENLQVALGSGSRVDLVPVHLAGREAEAASARGRPVPDFVLPNGAGLGYGEFHLDPASREWLSQHVAEIPDALTRGSAWVTLWDAVLDGELPAGRLIDLALAALPRESDELNVQEILGQLQQAYWTFTPPADRTARAAAIERVLRERLDAAATQSLKGSYFSALRNTALTAGTLDWLARVWRGDEPVAGLTLAETDFITLAQELAVREVPGWQAILARQVDRTANPDRKARLLFVIPALAADPAERDRFFASLSAIENRRHEAWVLDALRYLDHPLRAERSVRYIEPSLSLLREIQRTGDIFFPKRWMDLTLSGHRTPAAAAIVREFLDRAGAGYPDRLRRIILSSADDLFRASRL